MIKHILFMALLFMSTVAFGRIPDRAEYVFLPKAIDDSKNAANFQRSTWTLNYFRRIYLELKDDNLSKYLITHYETAIADDKGVEHNNKIRLSIYQENSLVDLRVRVIKDGKVITELSKSDLKKVKEEDQEILLLAVSSLSKGCILETIIQMEIGDDLYGYEYMQMNEDIANAQFSLRTPDHLKFDLKAYKTTQAVHDTIIDKYRDYELSLKDVPAFEDEEFSGKSSEKIRVEYVFSENVSNNSKARKYPELGRSILENMTEDIADSKSALVKLLKKPLKEASNDREKIYMIEHFLKTNFQMVEAAKVDNSLKAILKNKFCTAFGMNRLMISSFVANEIPFEVVVTCDRFKKPFDKNFHSWSYLQELVLYFPEQNVYVDPGNFLSRCGLPNPNILGQTGLFVKPMMLGDQISGISTFKTVQLPANVSNNDLMDLQVTFSADAKSVNINYHREMINYAEMSIRSQYFFIGEKERQQFLTTFVKNTGETCNVSDQKASNFDLSKPAETVKPFIIDANIQCDDYVEKAGNNIILKVGELIGKQSELYDDKERKYDVVGQYPHSYKRIIRIKIPKGYKPKGLEKLNFKDEFTNSEGKPSFGFTNSWKINGDEIVLDGTEYYNDLNHPKAMYQNFRKVINDAADFNKLVIVFEKL